MLNSVLIVGVPMVALLAAAFYVFTRAQREGYQERDGRGSGGESWFSSSTASRLPTSSSARRRRVPGNSGAHGDGTHTSSSDSGFADDKEDENMCDICFENSGVKVTLYPCEHSDICVGCVHKVLNSKRRQCPFCRARIDGYVEKGSKDLCKTGFIR